MRKTEKKQIGRHTYHVTQLGARDGARTLARLAKLLGPAFAAMSDGREAEALSSLTERIGPDDLDTMIDVFAPCTRVDLAGKMPLLSDIFDAHFIGLYDEMLGWLVFAVQVNFSSIFGGLPRAEATDTQGPPQSESPSI